MATSIGESVIQPGKPLSPEHKKLFDEIALRAELAKNGDWETIANRKEKTAAVVLQGGTRTVRAVGSLWGLADHGLRQGFDIVVANSGGAPPAASFLGDQIYTTPDKYYKYIASKEFINLRRRGRRLNIPYLGYILSEVAPLDYQAVANSGTDLYIGMTDVETVTAKYQKIDRHNAHKLVGYVIASAAVPGLAPAVKIDGRPYNDAVMTCTNPIEFAKELGANNILGILSRPPRPEATGIKSYASHLGGWALAKLLTVRYSSAMSEAYARRHEHCDERTDTEYTDINLAMVGPTTTISRLSRDRETFKREIEEAHDEMCAIIDSAF